jgi:outer membrane murein-binding lipoprotein Lpp
MRQAIVIVVALATLTITGCKSKHDQLTALNAQFDTLNAQYQKDCILASVEEMKRNDAKCKTERDEMNPLGKKILDLQADIAASKR